LDKVKRSIIVEGSIGAVGDKKVPLPLRILAAVFIIAVFGTQLKGTEINHL
jgi:hypothetical protein